MTSVRERRLLWSGDKTGECLCVRARMPKCTAEVDLIKLSANDNLAADQALAVHYVITSCPTGGTWSSPWLEPALLTF